MAVDLGKGTTSREVYVPDEGLKEKFFSYEGRLNRERYILRSLAVGFVTAILMFFAFFISEKVATLINVAAIVIQIMLGIRRTHDIGKSGWWMFLIVVPLVNIIWGLVLIFKKGDNGMNEYGIDPLEC